MTNITFIWSVCGGITAFAVALWLIERWNRKWYQRNSREILDDWNESTAMWSDLCSKLADENAALRKGKVP